MSILEIKHFPEQILCRHSKPINKVTGKELALFEDMLATMRRAQGIGLAAPQVGVNQRLIVVDIGQGPLKLANPEIITRKGKTMDRNDFERMKDEYYTLRGWDVTTGLQKKGQLEKLGLTFVADKMDEIGLLKNE